MGRKSLLEAGTFPPDISAGFLSEMQRNLLNSTFTPFSKEMAYAPLNAVMATREERMNFTSLTTRKHAIAPQTGLSSDVNSGRKFVITARNMSAGH